MTLPNSAHASCGSEAVNPAEWVGGRPVESACAESVNDTRRGRDFARRDPARDIAALASSGHVEAGGALPITQRVQTSGRGDPPFPRWSIEGERAQRILGRAYAEGGDARRFALALWLRLAFGERPTSTLAIGLGVVLETDDERRATLAHWWSWATGGSARRLVATAERLVSDALAWYMTASDEPGCAGVLAALVAEADAVRADRGVVGRMREWHRGWTAERHVCGSMPKRARCTRGPSSARCARIEARACAAAPRDGQRPFIPLRCRAHDDDCGCEWFRCPTWAREPRAARAVEPKPQSLARR